MAVDVIGLVSPAKASAPHGRLFLEAQAPTSNTINTISRFPTVNVPEGYTWEQRRFWGTADAELL